MADTQGKRPSLRAQGDEPSAHDSTGKPKASKADSRLVHVRMDEEMIERIDDFRFASRFNDRTRAIRWLLKWALNHAGSSTKPPETTKSSEKKIGGGR